MNDCQLTEHFRLHEFIRAEDLPTLTQEIHSKCWELAAHFLEPIRQQFNAPVKITSAYRPQQHNAVVGGVKDSFHLFERDESAADFEVESLQDVFDFIRLVSPLPFDEVILEFASIDKWQARDFDGACIHLQTNDHPRRIAKEGVTHNKWAYKTVDVAPLKEYKGPDDSGTAI